MSNTKISKKNNNIEEFDKNTYVNFIRNFDGFVTKQIDALFSFLSTSSLKINSEEKDLLALTLNSCKIIQNSIDIFLMTQKLNYEKISIQYKTFNFTKLVKIIIADIFLYLKYSKVELELNSSEDLYLYGDKEKLEKILRNIIINYINSANENSKICIDIFKKSLNIYFQIKTINTSNLYINNESLKNYDLENSISSMNTELILINEIIYAHSGNTYFKNYSNNINLFGFSIPQAVKKCGKTPH